MVGLSIDDKDNQWIKELVMRTYMDGLEPVEFGFRVKRRIVNRECSEAQLNLLAGTWFVHFILASLRSFFLPLFAAWFEPISFLLVHLCSNFMCPRKCGIFYS